MHHQRYCDWLEPDHCLAGLVEMRGMIPTEFGLMQTYAEQIARLIREAGVADMPVGLDYAETAMFHALREEGINVVDGQQIMLAARGIKTWDEIQLLTQAASMVDGVYHMIYEEPKPGVREDDMVAFGTEMLCEMGSGDVEAISLDHPMEIRTAMAFSLETYCPAADGSSAACIGEEVVVTETGCEAISLFLAEELPSPSAPEPEGIDRLAAADPPGGCLPPGPPESIFAKKKGRPARGSMPWPKPRPMPKMTR